MNVLLIVSGGIAAYKSIDLSSSLVKKRTWWLKVILTENAKKIRYGITFSNIDKK